VKFPWRRGETPEDGFVHEPLVLPAPPNPDFYDPAWDEWDTKRTPSMKTILIAVAVAIVLIGAFFGYKKLHSSKSSLVSIPPPTTFSIAQSSLTPKPTVFIGTASETTPQFTVAGGLTVLEASCKCSATKFQIQVLDSAQGVVSTPVATSGQFGGGTFAGSVPLSLPAGTYSLQIAAIGKWKVSVVSPPTNQPTLALTSRFFGSSGPSVIGPFAANRDFLVAWAFSFNPTPVKLQVIDSVTGSGTTIKETSGTAKPSLLRIPAQSSPFYLYQGDTQYLWGLLVKPAN
jgi:hypothetical protein